MSSQEPRSSTRELIMSYCPVAASAAAQPRPRKPYKKRAVDRKEYMRKYMREWRARRRQVMRAYVIQAQDLATRVTALETRLNAALSIISEQGGVSPKGKALLESLWLNSRR